MKRDPTSEIWIPLDGVRFTFALGSLYRRRGPGDSWCCEKEKNRKVNNGGRSRTRTYDLLHVRESIIPPDDESKS